eukprot:scaffold2779_cov114-Isochrysis_galbana.AAC.7
MAGEKKKLRGRVEGPCVCALLTEGHRHERKEEGTGWTGRLQTTTPQGGHTAEDSSRGQRQRLRSAQSKAESHHRQRRSEDGLRIKQYDLG